MVSRKFLSSSKCIAIKRLPKNKATSQKRSCVFFCFAAGFCNRFCHLFMVQSTLQMLYFKTCLMTVLVIHLGMRNPDYTEGTQMNNCSDMKEPNLSTVNYC